MARKKNNGLLLKARLFYIKGMSIIFIAQKLGISKQTFYTWRKKAKKEGDDWDYYRTLMGAGSIEGLALDIYADFGILLKRIRSLQDDDKIGIADLKEIYTAYDTMLRATRKVSTFIDKKSLCLDILDLLEQFTQNHHPSFHEMMEEVREPFGVYLLEVGFFNK